MKRRLNTLAAVGLILAMLASGTAFAAGGGARAAQSGDPDDIEWVVKYRETFDDQVLEPEEWVEDTYENEEYDIFYGDSGYAMQTRNENLLQELGDFSAYRKSYSFGEDNWLTVETYGRGADSETPPETGGRFIINGDGKAVMVCESHTDAAIIGSTNPLPSTYRLEVTVSNIDVGGRDLDENGRDVYTNSWKDWSMESPNPYVDYEGERVNGYFQDSTALLNAGPWIKGANAVSQNGMYFLSIVDYGNPKPHNNTFIHHHRKVAIDTDNNWSGNAGDGGGTWSFVYDDEGTKQRDGSRYISMLWIDANAYKGDFLNSGGDFYSLTSQGPEMGTTMVDKYKPGESYTFAVERTPESYTLEVSGDFYYGGNTTYRHTKSHIGGENNLDSWTYHFNQTLEELKGLIPPSRDIDYLGEIETTWPEEEVYPDYFYFGIPHINFYAGTAEFSDLTLYVPKGSPDDPEMNREATVEISGVAVTDKVYDGKSVVPGSSGLSIRQIGDEAELTEALKDYVTYTWYNTEDPDRALSIVPKSAGSYVLEVEIDIVKDALYRGVLRVPFTISKATVEITADDKSADVGQAEPAYTYTVTGLVDGEKLAQEPAVKGQGVNMSSAGTYVISATGGALPRRTAGNYNEIIYHNGKLTVTAPYYGGGSGGGSGSSGNKTGDGATVRTATDKTTGTVTTTVTYPDGVKAVAETTAAGVTTATVTLPTGRDAATVTIPVKGATAGMAAVLVKADGTEELVRNSVVTEDGITVPVTGDAKLKFVENAKPFDDVAEGNWAADAVAFVSSRELFQGTGGKNFSPAAPMTRGMLMTVLARLDGADTAGGATWYEKGVAWAAAKGVSNGENPEVNITREELAIMLYRYAGKPGTKGSLKDFSDADTVNGYAETPLCWAVEQGIINGKDGKALEPGGSASRAEVAAMLERFVKATA